MKKFIWGILFGALLLTGCNQNKAEKILNRELKRVEQKMTQVKKANARKLAPLDYKQTRDQYKWIQSSREEYYINQNYNQAKKDIILFHKLADATLEKINPSSEPELPIETPKPPPPKPKEPKPKPSITSYHVKKGDWLINISRTIYKDPEMWYHLYEANKDQIKDPDYIYPNTTLKLPAPPDNLK